MEKKGFEYVPVKERPITEARDFPYVIDDVAWARKHGYGTDVERDLAELRRTDPNQRYFRDLPADQREAALKAANGPQPWSMTAKAPDGMLFERSPEGCRSEAERELYGDLEKWFQAKVTVDTLAEIKRTRVIADPRFTEAVKSWASCMRAVGHRYSSPIELRATFSPANKSLPRSKEISLAVAEAKCAISSGLARTASERDAHYAEKLQEQHQSHIEIQRKLQLSALPHARSIVKRSPST
ncbi:MULTISPECIES: hypothetical protein [unclassified Streptomyces]|uniref:hypothetical protein n=1 Tax=unclassified Streptomyces TaxID=2593676 RepID=UPI0035DAD75A